MQWRWRVFLLVECLILFIFIVGLWPQIGVRSGSFLWLEWAFAILGAWLMATLPTAFLYLIGKPPVMTLAPLIPSAESRAFRRQLRGRPVLNDDEFFERFYAGSGIPRDIPARLRRRLLDVDSLLERVEPSDPVYLVDDEVDLADVLRLAGREFGVRITRADYPHVDGTFENLVRLIAEKLRA